MARNGSGTYSLPQAAFVSGSTIESAKVNSNFSDIGSEITASLAKDGQTVPTANLPMGTFKHTNVGAASARTDYARASQIADNSMGYAASSGTDTITAAPSPGITAYAVGQRFTLKKDSNANTGAVTLNINGVGAGAVTWPDGTALSAADLPANSAFEVVVQATTPVFHLQTVSSPARLSGFTLTGAINGAAWADVASASTCDIGAATTNNVRITGTTTITALGTVTSGTHRTVRFAGALTFTHNATSLILPTAANITTAANDTAEMVSLGSGNWICVDYQRAAGTPLASSGGSVVRVQTFTASGTYTPHANMVSCLLYCYGGGGGGGGMATPGANISTSSAGGGAGSRSIKRAAAADIGASQAVTIGAAGSGGSAGNNNGSAGGDTSIGALCIGKGGSGGGGAAGTSNTMSTGGAGGVAGTGDITSVGEAGGPGASSNFQIGIATGGFGGSSELGGGGRPTTSTSAAAAAVNGSGYASGGSGAAGYNGSGTAAGGNGTAGYAYVVEFCSA
jgi:hypothetical protein